MTVMDPNSQWMFARPETSETDMFIQWKGTDVCMDLQCPCGCSSHIHGYFANSVQCPECLSVYKLGCQVIAKRVPGDKSSWVEPVMGKA